MPLPRRDSDAKLPRQSASGLNQARRQRTLLAVVFLSALVAAIVAALMLTARFRSRESLEPRAPETHSLTTPLDAALPHDVSGSAGTAVLKVSSKPSGAAIRFCGEPTGLQTPASLAVEPGHGCELELELADHEPYRIQVTPSLGTRLIVATLRSKPGQLRSASRTGVLRVISTEEGTVYVDGRVRGHTPQLELKLQPGTYSVRVQFSSRGAQPAPRTATVKAGLTSVIHVDPQP